MKLIVGLGNPGKIYAYTRHNVGFWVIDELSTRWDIKLAKKKWGAVVGEGFVQGRKVILAKPETYMNRSGQAIASALDWLKLELDDLLVIYDDLDLSLGQIRLRQKGNSGGHNGIKSIISHIGSNEFKRVKIGIGKPDGRVPVADYVLSPFFKSEEESIKEAVLRASDSVVSWIYSGFTKAMNEYNTK